VAPAHAGTHRSDIGNSNRRQEVKAKLATLGFAAILGVVILSGCGSTAAQSSNGETDQAEDCLDADTGATLSYQQAVDIAEGSGCVEQGQLKETHFFNENTGTWWIDLDIEKAGCAPACVVNVSDRTAEINWRCTGLVPPSMNEAAK
jgi:outer membrane murein-binding lipoprotein Lpp